MTIDVKVPSAGESISEGELVSWRKQNGERVEIDEIIAEVETDKATLEIPSPAAGQLKLLSEVGVIVNVGQVIAHIDEGAAGTGTAPASTEAATAAQPATTTTPEPTTTTAAATAASPSAATTSTSTSPTAGAGTTAPAREGGQPLSTMSADLSASADAPSDLAFQGTPAARKLMREHGLTSSRLDAGTVGQALKNGKTPPLSTDSVGASSTATPPAGLDQSSPHPSSTGEPGGPSQIDRGETRKRISRLRATIAKRLVLSQQTGALLTTFNEVDMHALAALRVKYKEEFKKKYNVGLGYMSFFARATALALKEFPVIHSRMEADAIVEPHYVDIGVAVATPKGLVVPVLRNVDHLRFEEVEGQIKNFAIRGREGKLSMEELSGGTFTITNGGVFGSMLSTPIVNYPQSAILGMHNIVERPVAVGGEVVIHPVMYVALSYDHRLIDGSDAVRFLVRIKERIEDPMRLLIEI